MHEASLHDSNCFVTLTYDDAHNFPSLRYDDFKLFMKRLRKGRPPIKFYMCGEYGSLDQRPHFHALFFGLDFPDKYAVTGGKEPIFRSPILEKLWPFGFSSIGACTFESAAYVARYTTAKITGALAAAHYRLDPPIVHVPTGEIFHSRTPEFNRMSLRTAVAKDWLRLYWSDVRNGTVVVNGKECNIPRYYFKYFKNSTHGAAIKAARELEGAARRFDSTPARLAVRESIAVQRLNSLKRKI